MHASPANQGQQNIFAAYQPPSSTDIQVMARIERDRIIRELNKYRIASIGALAAAVFIALPIKRELGWSPTFMHWALVAILLAFLVALIISTTNTSSASDTAERTIRNRFLPLMPAEIEMVRKIQAATPDGAQAVATLQSRVPHLRSHEYRLLVEMFGHTVGQETNQAP